MKPLIAGNWKMNGLSASMDEVDSLLVMLDGALPDDRDVLICPPATLAALMAAKYADEGLLIGGQDCHQNGSGAHTGDISAAMLSDAGASFVIVGHSERRTDHGETSEIVCAKAKAALNAGLTPIICVGETEDERDAGTAIDVVGAQLAASIPANETEYVVAYEPVWAIGTGKVATAEDIAEMHAFIRKMTRPDIRILYGGSVKPANASEILSIENVNGALVGGASLKANDFHPIILAAPGGV